MPFKKSPVTLLFKEVFTFTFMITDGTLMLPLSKLSFFVSFIYMAPVLPNGRGLSYFTLWLSGFFFLGGGEGWASIFYFTSYSLYLMNILSKMSFKKAFTAQPAWLSG